MPPQPLNTGITNQDPQQNWWEADAPVVSTGEDVLRSIPTGIQRGVAGIVGFPGQVQQWENQFGDWSAQQIMRTMGMSPQDIEAQQQRVNQLRQGDQNVPLQSLTTPQQVNNAEQHVFGQQYNPQTREGRYAMSMAEFAPNALAPGGPITRIARAVVPGGMSEAAGEMTQGTPAEPYARFAGGVGGGLAVEGGAMLANMPDRMAATDIQGATQADFMAAQQLRQRAAAMGIDLTVAEALQQVTGGGTGAQGLQSWVESSRHGAPIMAPYLRNRPQQTETAVNQFADRVAPPMPDPQMLGPQAQRTAQGVLDTERRNINARARPDYQAAEQQTMPEADYQTLAADPVYAEALRRFRADPELGSQYANVPDNNIGLIGEVYRNLRDRSNAAAVSGENNLARIRGQSATNAEAALSNASPEFQRAQQTVAQGHAQTLDPMQAGPIGRIAGTDQVQQQTQALFPQAPLADATTSQGASVAALGAADADVTHNLARQHILGGRAGASERMQDLSGGENQYGMANWAASVAGNPLQRDALIAGFRALPRNGPQLASELADLLEVGQATGRRTPRNSETFSRTDRNEQARRTGLPDLRRSLGDLVAGQRVETLARWLTAHPDETAAVLSAARARNAPFRWPLAEAVLSQAPQPPNREGMASSVIAPP